MSKKQIPYDPYKDPYLDPKNLHLDAEEQELNDSLERGEWKPITNSKKIIQEHTRIFQAALRKTKHVNIRMNEMDYDGIKAKALAEGIPYQTLISSIIHKYISGTLRPS